MSSPSSSMDKAGLDADVLSDVIVVGGGPGGTTTATMLARKGWRVLLLEREHFPRDHVGESLLPASIPVLEELGALPAIQEAGFLPKWGATMVWGREREPWSWYFKETNQGNPHSYQVWRPRFDQLLLENSRAAGVDAREGHRVLEVLFEDDRAVGVRYAYDRQGADDSPGIGSGRESPAPGSSWMPPDRWACLGGGFNCASGTPSSRTWPSMPILPGLRGCPDPPRPISS